MTLVLVGTILVITYSDFQFHQGQIFGIGSMVAFAAEGQKMVSLIDLKSAVKVNYMTLLPTIFLSYGSPDLPLREGSATRFL